MSRVAYLSRRIGGLLVSVWAVFTLAFLYVAFTPYNEALVEGGDLPTSPGDPLFDRYVDWLVWFLTVPDRSVTDPLVESLQYTLVYLIPALLVAVGLGTAVRVYSVAGDGRLLDNTVDVVTIVGVSVPVFLLAFFMRRWFLVDFFSTLGYYRIYHPAKGPLTVRNAIAAVWPASAMTVYLLAIQLRYAGEELREYVSADFVKTARAKGASRWRVGRHVFRNTAVPLLTLFFTEMFGMVVVGVFVVEFVTTTPGVGELMTEAVLEARLPLILAIAVLTVLVGVVSNFLQDLTYLYADPRVDVEE